MTPAIRAAKRNRENVVAVVSERPFHTVLKGNPHIDQLLTSSRNQKLRSRLQLIRAIRKFKADLVFDLHGGSTSAILTYLSGARLRVGYEESRNSRFYNVRVPNTRELWGRDKIHTVEHQLAPLKYVGFNVEPIPDLHVPVDDEAFSRLQSLCWEDIADGDFILLHPAAAFETKQWPVERFIQLVHLLAADGMRVIASAGPGEEGLLEAMRKVPGDQLKILPPLPLSEFIALASMCRLYVGNDTGTTHIAAALGKPVVAVFGSSNADSWHPWGVPYRVLRGDLPCIPCPGYSCSEYDEPRCILSIGVDAVYKAVCELLG